jgi:uncharacterized protein (DUF1800 family)
VRSGAVDGVTGIRWGSGPVGLGLERGSVAKEQGVGTTPLSGFGPLPVGAVRLLEAPVAGPRADVTPLPAGPVATRPASSRVAPEQRLVQRVGFGFSRRELAHLESLRYGGYLARQLAPEQIDDSAVEAAVARQFPALSASPAQLREEFLAVPEAVALQLVLATLYRAVFSERPLLQRMALFWTDHFNVDLYATSSWYLLPAHQREVVHAHALGRFPELLRAAARSPALLEYLTNTTNRRGQINENFGRELLELHSLGEGSGYSDQDVREVARCFTGWTVLGSEAGPQAGRFHFAAGDHDQGSKTVLGHFIAAGGGLEDGETVLEILGDHPATARHVASRLVLAFWGEGAPAALVEEVAGRYMSSGGELRTMLAALLQRHHMAHSPSIFKRPFELAVSLLRALEVESFDPFFVLGALIDAGQLPYAWPRPDGYPLTRSYWSGALLPRWRLAFGLTDSALSGIDLDLGRLFPGPSAKAVAIHIEWLLANGTFEETTRRELLSYLQATSLDPPAVRRAVALALAAPELQEA